MGLGLLGLLMGLFFRVLPQLAEQTVTV